MGGASVLVFFKYKHISYYRSRTDKDENVCRVAGACCSRGGDTAVKTRRIDLRARAPMWFAYRGLFVA